MFEALLTISFSPAKTPAECASARFSYRTKILNTGCCCFKLCKVQCIVNVDKKRFSSAAVLWNCSCIFLLEPEKTGSFGSSSEWINAEQFLFFWLKNYNISLICMCKRKVTGIKRFIFIKNKLKNNWWHRLISRDRPTKTGSLCLCRPFFYVAALNVCI